MGLSADGSSVKLIRALLALLALSSCSSGGGSSAQSTSTSTSSSLNLNGLPPGAARLSGRVGPGRPGESGVIPPLTLTFSNGEAQIETTVKEGNYTVDLPAGTWQVHANDGNLCATGLTVAPGGAQNDDLIWPSGSCEDRSGPPSGAAPPAGPTPAPSH